MAKKNIHTEYNALFNSIVRWMDDNGLTIAGNGGVRNLVNRYCSTHHVSNNKRSQVNSVFKTLDAEERGE